MLHGGAAHITHPTMYSIEFSNRCLVLACRSDALALSLCVTQMDQFSVRQNTLKLKTLLML